MLVKKQPHFRNLGLSLRLLSIQMRITIPPLQSYEKKNIIKLVPSFQVTWRNR